MPRRTSGHARRAIQRDKRDYTHQREDKQLAGAITTTPAGAIWDERVPVGPDTPMPELVRLAIQRGWNTSEEGKQKCVDDLVAAIQDPDTRESLRIRCFQALLLADRVQHERE